MPDLRTKALGYLRDGKVTVIYSRTPRDDSEAVPVQLIARIYGHQGKYLVEYDDGKWWCTCPAWINTHEPCAHIAATQLVTGHPSLAAKVAKTQREAA